MKIPSLEDFNNHDGLHYHKLWKSIDNEWTCPGCNRTKFQLMRWTKRFPNTPKSIMDWVATLHKHHDHYPDFFPQKNPRFPETLICGQCNSVDGRVKRKLKLPVHFSFSPIELRSFIHATPHDKHRIDFSLAQEIYDKLNL